MYGCPCFYKHLRASIGAGQAKNLVSGVDEFRDDFCVDKSGRACQKDTQCSSPWLSGFHHATAIYSVKVVSL